ncbi:MAG TPA: DUF899 domain-containing protein [Caulobacteraceae bacterium]|nr:DUF899 domain-containing protein [Caulobacteraceae bacterium]
MQHQVVSLEAWIEARTDLTAKEKAATHAYDELGREQRAMPWVWIEKDYVFEGPSGPVTLAELFADRSQLFIKHFMLWPGKVRQCVGCSLEVDDVAGLLEHLHNHDVTYAVVAPAAIADIEAMRRRMDWRFPWVSSLGNDFSLDMPPASYPDEHPGGNDVFYKNEADEIFHTFQVQDRGGEAFMGIYRMLDVTPKGRDETGPYYSLADWVRPRTSYARGGEVARDGECHPPASGCGLSHDPGR